MTSTRPSTRPSTRLAHTASTLTRSVRGLVSESGRPVSGPGVARNARLTATTGIVLMVVLAVQGVTLLNVRGLITLHVVVGTLLVAPLAVKLASTGYRMVRYYLGADPYVRKGPPHPLMRVLAPFLVLATVVLMGSGFGLVLAGPASDGWLGPVHVISFWCWLGLAGVHVLVYLWRVPHLIGRRDKRTPRTSAIGGSPLAFPLVVNAAGLVLAAVLALQLLPVSHVWGAHR
jgi:hypothetical protein